MTEGKIKAVIPMYVGVDKDLKSDKTRISHEGTPVIEKDGDLIRNDFKDCGSSLEWYMKGADSLFASEADRIELKVGCVSFAYDKIRKVEISNQKHFDYILDENQCQNRLVEVDAGLIEE